MAVTRDGVPTLLKWATKLCATLNKFNTILAVKYADNTALLAALAAASVACQTLNVELEKVRDYGD